MNIFYKILYTLVCIIIGMALGRDYSNKKSNIDLPEEYKAITIEDNLKGYWNDDTLHIYFSNPDNALIEPDYMIQFINHGDSVIIQSTGDNKLFTVPYDSLVRTIELDNL